MLLTQEQMAQMYCEINGSRYVHRKEGRPGQCGDCRVPAHVFAALLRDTRPSEEHLELSPMAESLLRDRHL